MHLVVLYNDSVMFLMMSIVIICGRRMTRNDKLLQPRSGFVFFWHLKRWDSENIQTNSVRKKNVYLTNMILCHMRNICTGVDMFAQKMLLA